jgi:hypothetical protein
MNFSTILDNLIAMVVVLLILSLVVQSIQSGLKKLFKIKSRQIEDSLVDLFEQVLDKPPDRAANFLEQSPMLRMLFFQKHPSEFADPKVKSLYDDVLKKFSDLGRVAQSGKGMLDSLAKDDLLKVLEKVVPGALVPGFMANLQKVADEISAVEKAIGSIDPSKLSGDTSAKFAAMQARLTPLLNDFKAIVTGTTITPEILIGDVISLRELKLNDALSILGEMQAKVEKDMGAARVASTPAGTTPTSASELADASLPVLKQLAEGFNSVADSLAKLRNEFDSAIAPLRGKLKEVESWFDTVMQSFDERYARGMKTWAIVISFVVVVFLNANFFNIYQKISTNEVVRNNLVQGQARLKELQQAADRAAAEPTGTVPALKATLKEQENTVRGEIDAYASFGFTPLSMEQINNWATGKSSWSVDWGQRLVHMAKILLGWILMALLLSVGAPFWEDTLESLFGLKNILRTSSETKNVEKKSGTGQPKT